MERLDDLMYKFKTHSETHPNIATLWINYMKIKKENLESLLEQGNKIIDTINENQDIPLETLPFLIMLKNGMANEMANENNT